MEVFKALRKEPCSEGKEQYLAIGICPREEAEEKGENKKEDECNNSCGELKKDHFLESRLKTQVMEAEPIDLFRFWMRQWHHLNKSVVRQVVSCFLK